MPVINGKKWDVYTKYPFQLKRVMASPNPLKHTENYPYNLFENAELINIIKNLFVCENKHGIQKYKGKNHSTEDN